MASIYREPLEEAFSIEYDPKWVKNIPDTGDFNCCVEHIYFVMEGLCSNNLIAQVAFDIWTRCKNNVSCTDAQIVKALKSSMLVDMYSPGEFIETIEHLFLPYITASNSDELTGRDFVTKQTLPLFIKAVEHRCMLFNLDYWVERGKWIGCLHNAFIDELQFEGRNNVKKSLLKPISDIQGALEKRCKKDITLQSVFGNVHYTMLYRIIKEYFGTMVLMSFQNSEVFPMVFDEICKFFGDMVARGAMRVAAIDALGRLVESPEQEKEVEAEVKPKVKRKAKKKKAGKFTLTGRHELCDFFNENVIDVVENADVYAKFGIGFPEPFLLEGPPGCGKTYAIERLSEHLGWNTYHITSSSIGSTLIHETSQKTEKIFKEATKKSPSMVVIDEMDAFMPDRSRMRSSDSHHAEEVASFLKCIQDASKNKVLVVGMTNLLSNIDPAILRSGRMGKHLKVDMPSKEEIVEVIEHELAKRPHGDIDCGKYAENYLDKPLSDVVALVREASMTAARQRAEQLTEEHFDAAIAASKKDNKEEKRIGFATA